MMIEKFKVGPHVVSRAIGDQVLLLIPDKDQIQQLNEVGSFIWSILLERESDLDELSEAVSVRFTVSPETAWGDISSFIEDLRAQELIEVRVETDPQDHQS